MIPYSNQFCRKGASLKSDVMVSIVFLLLPVFVCSQGKENLKSPKDIASYSIGIQTGRNMKRQSLDLNLDVFLRGIKDGLSDAKPALTDAEMQEVMTAFQKEMMAKMNENAKNVGEKNKREGDAFLAENKKKPGVITLPSGLRYKILKEGVGKSPKVTDTVATDYRGTLLDGEEFDNSYKRREAATFPLNRMIAGWTEALQHMKLGSKRRLFVPSNLAYGENGAGQDIGPHATLNFEVELLDIKK